MAAIAKMLMAGALSVAIVVVILIVVCEIIDMTRRTKDPIAGLDDEESDPGKGGER